MVRSANKSRTSNLGELAVLEKEISASFGRPTFIMSSEQKETPIVRDAASMLPVASPTTNSTETAPTTSLQPSGPSFFLQRGMSSQAEFFNPGVPPASCTFCSLECDLTLQHLHSFLDNLLMFRCQLCLCLFRATLRFLRLISLLPNPSHLEESLLL
jgi:hypothetical protein